MVVNSVGPVYTGSFEQYVINDETGEEYTIKYAPDLKNQELQQAGLAPCYYWMPGEVRLAKKGPDLKFHQIHYVGVFDEDTSVGLGNAETQGGILTFTATSRYPAAVLKQAEDQLLEKFRGSDERYWGWRSPVAPRISMVPIIGNVTAVTNLTGLEGTFLPSSGAAGGGNGAGAPRRTIRLAEPRSVPHGRNFRAPTMAEPWGFNLQGQGPGSVTGGENAYSAMMGALASETIWAGFHGVYSPINVYQDLQIQMYSQMLGLKITGNWDRIFEHFSAAAQGRYYWVSADIKAEFNNLRISGGIKVDITIDGTAPGAGDMEREVNKRIDTVVAAFTEQAKAVIFVPAPAVPPADASAGGAASLLPFGAGFALKYRRDETKLNLSYDETRNFRYIHPERLSSTMEGFFNIMKDDPEAERKYFTRLVLGGIGGKITRLVKPVANMRDQSKGWVGDPIAFLSAQVGYPDPQGTIIWKANDFSANDPPDARFTPAFVMALPDEVQNPPQDWTPDKAFLKRRVHLLEPPGETEFPNMRVQVEQNVIELDEGPNGSLNNDKIVEVRADRAGVLDVGPVMLSAMLESEAQMVEVEFRPQGKRIDGTDRSSSTVRFRWNFTGQDEPRFWRIFTGQKDFVPDFDYRVHVTIRGTLFNKGMAWSGPWALGSGNGPLVVDVPAPGATGVVMRRLTPREIVSRDVVHVEAPGVGAPGEGASIPSGIEAPGTGIPVGESGGVGAPRSRRVSGEDLSLTFAPVPTKGAARAAAEPAGSTSGPAAYEAEMEAQAREARATASRSSKVRSIARSGKARSAGSSRSTRVEEPSSAGESDYADGPTGDQAAATDAWTEVPAGQPR